MLLSVKLYRIFFNEPYIHFHKFNIINFNYTVNMQATFSYESVEDTYKQKDVNTWFLFEKMIKRFTK